MASLPSSGKASISQLPRSVIQPEKKATPATIKSPPIAFSTMTRCVRKRARKAANDSSALGAVDAVREQKRERSVAIVGQDCIADAVTEMRRERSPLIGSVSHQTNSYGPSLIHLGLQLLRGLTVPPYNYVEHKVVTRESLE